MIWQALAAFAALTVLDFVWAQYTHSVAHGTALAAGLWAIPIYAIGMSATIQIVQQHWLVMPACAGCFAGTYLSVWWKRRTA